MAGAVLLSGTGAERVWVVNEAALSKASIIVPDHFSGRVEFTAQAQTTEDDGHEAQFATAQVSFIVTATPESAMTTSGVIDESSAIRNQPQNIGLGVDAKADTDETVSAVGIPVGYATGQQFTLYVPTFDGNGVQTGMVALDSLQPTTVSGIAGAYYLLTPQQVAGLSAIGAFHAKGTLGSFDFIYKAADAPIDGSSGIVAHAEWQSSTFTITANPVTDPVTLRLDDVTGDAERQLVLVDQDNPEGAQVLFIDATGSFEGNERDFTLTFGVTTPDTNAGVTEKAIRLVFEGVPEGTSVKEGHYLGGGKWVLTLSEGQTISGTAHSTLSASFLVSRATDELSTIKTTVHSVDASGAERVTDTLEWLLDTRYGGPGASTDAPLFESFEALDVTLTEDMATALSEMFKGKANAAVVSDYQVTLTLDSLPEGSEVTALAGFSVAKTYIDNKEVWSISTLVAKGQTAEQVQATLDGMLQAVQVTPPAHANSQNQSWTDGDFTFNATLTAYQYTTGHSETLPAISANQVAQVSDPVEIAISNPDVVVSEKATQVAFKINLDNLPDEGFATIVDGKIYVQIAGVTTGTLSVGGVHYALTQVDGTSASGALLPAGAYFQLPVDAAKKTLDVVYNRPADAPAFTLGKLDVTVHAVGREIGADPVLSQTTHAITIAKDHDRVSSTMGTVAITGIEAQDNSRNSLIRLAPSYKLNDAGEKAGLVMLAGVPAGFLVYTGTSADDASVASMTLSGGSGKWVLTDNGDIPPYVAILPPRYWSGTIDTLELLVTSGETNMTAAQKEAFGANVTDTLKMPDVVIAPIPSEFTISPTDAFGKLGEIAPLNLNASLKDSFDDTPELVTLTFSGLPSFSKFYAAGVALDDARVSYDGTTYTVHGLTSAELQSLGLRTTQTKADIAVTAQNGPGATVQSATFKLDVSGGGTATDGDDHFVWADAAINGGEGIDTVHARFDTITGANLSNLLRNIEILDLQIAGSNKITDLTPQQVDKMTDGGNRLKVLGTALDQITLSGDWTNEGNGVFTGKVSDNKSVTLQLGADASVQITITPPAQPVMAMMRMALPSEEELFSFSQDEAIFANLPPAAPSTVVAPDDRQADEIGRDMAEVMAFADFAPQWSLLDELKLDEV